MLLLGLLAAGSGAVKLRQRPRSRLGVSPWAVAEVVVGAATVLGSGLGLARARPAAWTVVGATLVLVFVSSLKHFARALEEGRRRAESEEARLRRYVQS